METTKTIEVNYFELMELIIKACPYFFYNYAEGMCCTKKVDKEKCSLHAFADELHCPLDCPRLTTKEYSCDRGRCPRVRSIIKTLKR